jgi:hypothetical protein
MYQTSVSISQKTQRIFVRKINGINFPQGINWYLCDLINNLSAVFLKMQVSCGVTPCRLFSLSGFYFFFFRFSINF